MKLLSNLPVENLTKENDYLGVIEKGDMIVSLLKSGNINFEEIKMFALYGNWGSGKSTLMRYVEKKLEDDFNTFYFDAWKYENDTDLSFSLLEFLIDTGHSKLEKECKNFLDIGKKVLIGSLKGINPIIKNVAKELQNQNKKSFHKKINEFEEEFEKFESVLHQETHFKYNIVFIDDLDRCEPEKVLDLLSEIKLFFNYGKRTIFFFGVDEKAVQAAIKTKYDTVLKSNEYLEKVFDLTFHLRADNDIKKFVYGYFPKRTIKNIGSGVSYQKYIYEFVYLLKLTNPRKLKKLLNAYSIYGNYIIQKNLNVKHQLIIDENNDGSFLNTIITLFLIACRLFFPQQFDAFCEPQDLKRILSNQTEVEPKANSKVQEVLPIDLDEFVYSCDIVGSIFHNLNEKVKSTKNMPMKNLLKINNYTFGRFAIVFAPLSTYNFKVSSLSNLNKFTTEFSADKNDVGYNMMWYLYSRVHASYDLSKDLETSISLREIKSNIKRYL